MTSYPSYSTKVSLVNSIISNNGSPQQNCSSFFGFVYVGTNISNDWSCGEVGIMVADPLLLPLANNGGPVLTHAFPGRSPARNAGGTCSYDTDARYIYRDIKCDPGAYEFDRTKVTITIDPTVKVDATGKSLLTGTIKCSRFQRGEDFRRAQVRGAFHSSRGRAVEGGPAPPPSGGLARRVHAKPRRTGTAGSGYRVVSQRSPVSSHLVAVANPRGCVDR